MNSGFSSLVGDQDIKTTYRRFLGFVKSLEKPESISSGVDRGKEEIVAEIMTILAGRGDHPSP